ncbi:MAG: hypothetical protein AABX03_03200 [Nanoarchaeota archaeon]
MGKRVKFGNSKVQQLNRVALPVSLLENLNLGIGDGVELYLDVENNEIIIKKEKGKVKNEKK